MTDLHTLARLLDSLDVSADQLRRLTTLREEGEPSLRDAFAQVHRHLPGWLASDGVSHRRLLDGEPERIGRSGLTIPAIIGLGDLPLSEFELCAAEHVEQVQAHVSAVRRDSAAANGRYLASSDPRDHGYGAAERSAALIRGVAAAVGRHLRVALPVAEHLKYQSRRGEVHGCSRTEISGWDRTLRLRRQDPVLDELVLSFVCVTGARRRAVCDLVLGSFDLGECRVRLAAKGRDHQAYRVPLHRSLMLVILEHAFHRGARRLTDPAFLRLGSAPAAERRVTRKYFEQLFKVLTADQPLSHERQHLHRLRHTAIDRVDHGAPSVVSLRFGDHKPDGAQRTHLRYVDLPEQQFFAAMDAAFGPYADCALPAASLLPPWSGTEIPDLTSGLPVEPAWKLSDEGRSGTREESHGPE